jgi:hypothetical protein
MASVSVDSAAAPFFAIYRYNNGKPVPISVVDRPTEEELQKSKADLRPTGLSHAASERKLYLSTEANNVCDKTQ